MGYKRLLVLGTGVDQVPGIKRAKEMGLYVVGLDANPESAGKSLVDEFYPVSVKSLGDVREFVSDYRGGKIDGVVAFGVDIPDVLAMASEMLGLTYYVDFKSALLSKDKYLAKERMREYGVNLPEYRKVETLEELKRSVKDFGYPCVLKPVDNSGARGVLRLTKGVDLAWAYAFSRGYSKRKYLIVERFLPGVQISTESFVVNGEVYTVGLSERNYEYMEMFSPFIVENGGDLPPLSVSREWIPAIDVELKKAARAFGVSNGIIKGDVVIDEDKVYIIEVALRLSGGHFSSIEIPLNTGIDFLGNAIRMALGEDVDVSTLVYEPKRFVSLRYLFPYKTGILEEVKFPEWMEGHSGVYAYGLYSGRGDKVSYPVKDHTERLGYFVVFSEGSRDEVVDLVKRIYDDVVLRIR